MMFKKKRELNKNAGSTMVETLVSFVVLFIVLAGLYGIVSFSSELYMKSVDTNRMHQKFYQEVYKFPSGNVSVDSVNYDTSFLEATAYLPGDASSEDDTNDYASLGLMLDKDKTAAVNYNSDSTISDTYINLSKMGITSFVCINQDAIDEELIRPKILHCWWDAPTTP